MKHGYDFYFDLKRSVPLSADNPIMTIECRDGTLNIYGSLLGAVTETGALVDGALQKYLSELDGDKIKEAVSSTLVGDFMIRQTTNNGTYILSSPASSGIYIANDVDLKLITSDFSWLIKQKGTLELDPRFAAKFILGDINLSPCHTVHREISRLPGGLKIRITNGEIASTESVIGLLSAEFQDDYLGYSNIIDKTAKIIAHHEKGIVRLAVSGGIDCMVWAAAFSKYAEKLILLHGAERKKVLQTAFLHAFRDKLNTAKINYIECLPESSSDNDALHATEALSQLIKFNYIHPKWQRALDQSSNLPRNGMGATIIYNGYCADEQMLKNNGRSASKDSSLHADRIEYHVLNIKRMLPFTRCGILSRALLLSFIRRKSIYLKNIIVFVLRSGKGLHNGKVSSPSRTLREQYTSYEKDASDKIYSWIVRSPAASLSQQLLACLNSAVYFGHEQVHVTRYRNVCPSPLIVHQPLNCFAPTNAYFYRRSIAVDELSPPKAFAFRYFHDRTGLAYKELLKDVKQHAVPNKSAWKSIRELASYLLTLRNRTVIKPDHNLPIKQHRLGRQLYRNNRGVWETLATDEYSHTFRTLSCDLDRILLGDPEHNEPPINWRPNQIWNFIHLTVYLNQLAQGLAFPNLDSSKPRD